MATPLMTLFTACFAGITFLYALPNNLKKTYQVGGLWIVFIAALIGCNIFNGFSLDALQFQFLSESPWMAEMKIDLNFGLDGISFVFLILTVLIFPFCVLASWKVKEVKFLFINLLLIEFFLVLTFTTLDLFLFCLFFESLLIPMFFIILFWGSRDRRIKALTYFVLYTLFGSIFLITALFLLYSEVHSTGFSSLLSNDLSNSKQSIFWMLLFITFSIKIPMFPFHIWLPEAHVEAPTVGSVILAGLLLKLGAYGMLRFLFIFENAKLEFQPYVLTICLISIFLASFIAIRQLDMKRIIAYSSIAHMNFALLGYFSNNLFGMAGGTLLMVSHGLVSSALFLLIGVLYERYHTRSVLYYGGLVTVMPLFATFFFLFTISNFSFPGTSNFIGELFVFIGLGLTPAKVVFILGAVSTFFGLVYSLLLYNRVTFGNLKHLSIQKFTDITRREFGVLFVLLALSTAMGFFPNILIEPITASLTALTHNTTAILDVVVTLPVDTAHSLPK
jgi:proton-translocating NADH-quinone oxidoreductase chain M